MSSLLDPSLLEGLTEEQRQEALAAAAAARRAEERSEQRAIERALREKALERERERAELERRQQHQQQQKQQDDRNGVGRATKRSILAPSPGASTDAAIVFVPKHKRDKAGQSSNETVQETVQARPSKQQQQQSSGSSSRSHASSSIKTSKPSASSPSSFSRHHQWTEKERQAIQATYLGKSSTATATNNATESNGYGKRKAKTKSNKKITFRFEWDNVDDTLDDSDPLYAPMTNTAALQRRDSSRNGRGRGSSSSSSSRYNNNYKTASGGGHAATNIKTKKKRRRAGLRLDDDDEYYDEDSHNNHHDPNRRNHRHSSSASYLLRKPITQMTSRDWRIFRENYEILVRGGRSPPPLRHFSECPLPGVLPKLHPALIQAIDRVMKYREPTPIQRQAIPIGLQRRDLIGIAETGSGKTCAFGVPLLQYLLQLPISVTSRVAEEGPLALVVAPTRELALQIHGELQKLSSCTGPSTNTTAITTCVVVGGQPIQQQAQQLRSGVHVVVGTPGRMNDCIEMAYLVLNQCCYIVLDEADRMIDMGFAPQMESILDSMGGLLKSENEQEAYLQEEMDLKRLLAESGDVGTTTTAVAATTTALPKHRVTSMFSATMPLEIERLAKQYLRHPTVISIGDVDSVKNARIIQRVIFLTSPAQKENALRDLLHSSRSQGPDTKIIVFVNEKKHADGIGRLVERLSGRTCVVLHGGKSQDQREENLATFRRGNAILVATDVAGRGLDIPNVAHVINYDLPSRSIDTYSHRIGRTGRAGKEGLATSFLTEEDTGIMAPLKAYLEATGNAVPDRLARHPAASSNTQGNLIY